LHGVLNKLIKGIELLTYQTFFFKVGALSRWKGVSIKSTKAGDSKSEIE
jgi:hypothetical protein